jgi:hypothetical protein
MAPAIKIDGASKHQSIDMHLLSAIFVSCQVQATLQDSVQ